MHPWEWGESIMTWRYQYSPVADRLVIIWVLLTALLLAQNPENFKKEAASLIGKFYPNLKISRSTDYLNVFSVDTSKNLKFKLYYTTSALSDAGIFLFPDQFFQFYDSRVLNFVERDLLLIYLNKGKAIPLENVKYKLDGKDAGYPVIYSFINSGMLTGLLGLDLKTSSKGKKKFYTAVLKFPKGNMEITFPARVDLILGAGWEDLADELTENIRSKDSSQSYTAYTLPVPLIEKRTGHREDIFEDVLDTSFISGDCRFYYSKDSLGFHPVNFMKEPVEHLNNIFVGQDLKSLATVSVSLKIKNYGAKFSEFKVNMPHLIAGLAGGKNIFLAFEEYKGRKIVDLFFPDKDLNYFHLFYFEVDSFSLASIQNITVKGWLYPYLRLDNLNEIDKEFDGQGKPKWRVPVGN